MNRTDGITLENLSDMQIQLDRGFIVNYHEQRLHLDLHLHPPGDRCNCLPWLGHGRSRSLEGNSIAISLHALKRDERAHCP